uniref:Basic salivary proline-rich protein 2 n=1 Tax=Phallusia mammillata TaxID=59560 RepID=A0A6F9DNW2_9ASCI|nr:basic salivary proline-rich protein 2 [Phallusia mammillata]
MRAVLQPFQDLAGVIRAWRNGSLVIEVVAENDEVSNRIKEVCLSGEILREINKRLEKYEEEYKEDVGRFDKLDIIKEETLAMSLDKWAKTKAQYQITIKKIIQKISEIGKGHPNMPPPHSPKSSLLGIGKPEDSQRPPKSVNQPQWYQQKDLNIKEDSPERQPTQPQGAVGPSYIQSTFRKLKVSTEVKSIDSGYGESSSCDTSPQTCIFRSGSNVTDSGKSSKDDEHAPSSSSPSLPKPPTDLYQKGDPGGTRRSNIEHQSWYHDVSREVAEEMVLKLSKDGSFLVRPGRGKDNPYTITGCDGKFSSYNLRIRKRDDRQYALGSRKPHERTFTSVSDLIEYYKTHPLTLANAEGSITLAGPL